jgi:hypothetical protein
MKRQKLILTLVVVALIGGTAFLLAAVPQKLGPPGVKAHPVPGSQRWQIDLPEHVLDFSSTNHGVDAKALEMLPQDTSIAERIYYKPGALPFVSSVVLMGTDRTSIHKAQYCLQGEGMHIDQMTRETVHLDQPRPYDLPIIKIVASDSVLIDDKKVTKQCVYVYWYVADNGVSNDPSGFGRMWSMTKQLLFTGVLQRWAYVRFYAFCDPGQEDATFAQLKQVIAASVPQFQLMPGPAGAAVAAQEH